MKQNFSLYITKEAATERLPNENAENPSNLTDVRDR